MVKVSYKQRKEGRVVWVLTKEDVVIGTFTTLLSALNEIPKDDRQSYNTVVRKESPIKQGDFVLWKTKPQ